MKNQKLYVIILSPFSLFQKKEKGKMGDFWSHLDIYPKAVMNKYYYTYNCLCLIPSNYTDEYLYMQLFISDACKYTDEYLYSVHCTYSCLCLIPCKYTDE